MKFLSFTLFFSFLGITMSPCHAMDVEPLHGVKQASPLLRMPPEVLEHILKLVTQDNPDAIGNLAKIQEICKGLAEFLSKDEMKWILELDQFSLNWRFFEELRKLNPTNVQILINLGASVEVTDIERALSSAVEHNDQNTFNNLLKIIQILEKKGATWEFISHAGWLCRYAITHQNLPIIKMLVDRGYKPIWIDFTTAFEKENIKIVELLLESEAPLDPRAFSFAVKITKNPKIVKLLIDHGANVNQVDEYESTPLDSAIYNESLDIVQLLLKHGATQSQEMLTHAVLHNRNPTIIKLLIEYGANVNEIGGHDFTMPPLAYVQSAQVAKVLLQAGAQLFIDCEGKTSLKELVINAILNKDPMILVEVLRQRYAYQTALAIAVALMAGAPYISAVCNIL